MIFSQCDAFFGIKNSDQHIYHEHYLYTLAVRIINTKCSIEFSRVAITVVKIARCVSAAL